MCKISNGKSTGKKKKMKWWIELVLVLFFLNFWKRERGNGDRVQRQNWILKSEENVTTYLQY